MTPSTSTKRRRRREQSRPSDDATNTTDSLHMEDLERPPDSAMASDQDQLSPVDFDASNPDAATDRHDASMAQDSHDQKPISDDDHTNKVQTGPFESVFAGPVQPPSGVAWLSGNTLRFPNVIRLAAGQIIMLGQRPYEIRNARVLTPMFWLKWCGMAVMVVLAVIGLAQMLAEPPGGSISGVIVDRITGRVIPSARISISGGPMISSNAAGLFAAGGMPAGPFELTATAPGYEPQTGTVVRRSGADAQLAFALTPLVIDSSDMYAVETSQAPAEDESPEERSSLAYGHVKLDVDFNQYLVFVDNVLYGKNADKVKRLTAGSHSIALQVEGYEDYISQVEVKARATETLRVAKADLKPKSNPLKRAKGHFVSAKEFLDQGQWQAAVDAYDRGLEFDPDNADALQYRGWAHMKLGQIDKARADFVKAADGHYAANRHLDAITCASYLIEMEPDVADHYRRRAEYNVAVTEYDKAIEDYEQAIKRDKKSLALRLGLAETYYVAGEFKDAAKEYDRARRMTEDPFDIYVHMLIALTKAGEDRDVRRKYDDLKEFADPGKLDALRQNPEWLRVLQIVDPTERSDG